MDILCIPDCQLRRKPVYIYIFSRSSEITSPPANIRSQTVGTFHNCAVSICFPVTESPFHNHPIHSFYIHYIWFDFFLFLLCLLFHIPAFFSFLFWLLIKQYRSSYYIIPSPEKHQKKELLSTLVRDVYRQFYWWPKRDRTNTVAFFFLSLLLFYSSGSFPICSQAKGMY